MSGIKSSGTTPVVQKGHGAMKSGIKMNSSGKKWSEI